MPLLGTIVNQKLGWGDLMSNHSHAIRQSFILKDRFTRRADATIVKIKDLQSEKCAKSNCRKRNFVYIGVHIRRQDAQRDLVERFKVWRTFYDCLIWMNRNLLIICVFCSYWNWIPVIIYKPWMCTWRSLKPEPSLFSSRMTMSGFEGTFWKELGTAVLEKTLTFLAMGHSLQMSQLVLT